MMPWLPSSGSPSMPPAHPHWVELHLLDADQVGDPHGVAFLQGAHFPSTAVRASVAAQVGCAGAVQRVLMGPLGRIIAIEAPHRAFTAHQRRAIALHDGGCVIPGCSVPATWCEIHHVTPWACGGATTTDNAVLLCWHHHRTLEMSGWTITMDEGVPRVSAGPLPWSTTLRRSRPPGTEQPSVVTLSRTSKGNRPLRHQWRQRRGREGRTLPLRC